MLLDLISTDNYVSFNKKLAHIIGLNESIYVNQLVNIMGKALKKDKMNQDGYINLDRDYIFNQTTLTIDAQLEIDNKLEKINLLLRDLIDPNLVKIDTQLLASITTEDDLSTLKDISKVTKKGKKADKDTKRYYIIQKLCENIQTNNSELDVLLKGWVESVVTKIGFLNAQIIEKFQNDLYKYCKGKLEIAKEIVNIATIYGYRDCQWAVKKYEEDVALSTRGEVKEVASKEALSKKQF